MTEEVRDLKVPEEWRGVPVKVVAPPIIDNRAGLIVVVTLMLADGTNIVGLSWPTGVRWVRCGPPNGWGLDERYDGDAPAGEDLETVDLLWRGVLESVKCGRDEAEAEFGGRP